MLPEQRAEGGARPEGGREAPATMDRGGAGRALPGGAPRAGHLAGQRVGCAFCAPSPGANPLSRCAGCAPYRWAIPKVLDLPLPRLQIVTVEELLSSPAPPIRIPMARSDTYKKAAREERTGRQGSLDI